MPVIPHNFNLPFNILRVSYADIGVTHLDASANFYLDTLGMIETEETNDAVYLRCLEERQHHSYILRKADKPKIFAIGFKVSKEDDLNAIKMHLDNLGLVTDWIKKYAQGRTLSVQSPEGICLEFYYSMAQTPRMLQNYGAYKGVQPQRFDHVNFFTPDAQATYEFFVHELGFRLTEYTETEDGDMWAAWVHRKGSVHDVAFTNGAGPRLHHTAIWVPNALNIIHLCDVMATTGFLENIERGPGRHGISNAFFLYIRDPDGHRIEIYTSDYLTVDTDIEPIRWDLRDPQRQTLWGHAAPQSWFTEGSVFNEVPVKDSKLKARPIIAG